MPHILMRGGKSPFQAISYEDTLDRNVLGTNSGNLIFAESTWRMLSTADTTITPNGYAANSNQADWINANYDVFVLPFANAFRKSFLPHLRKYTALIEQLDIPVVVTGVGAQAPINADAHVMNGMRDDVRAFCSAVLARSASIGVRGAYTYEFLRDLGFSDDQVDVIGCPSMFYYGAEFPEIRTKQRLDKTDTVSMNVSPYVSGIADIFEHNYAHYDRLTYVPQNNESLDQILWDGATLATNGKVFPKTTDHPMFQADRLRFFIDTKTWIDHLSNYDFVFGTRIHGNIMALLAGTPGFVMAHDSRTLELAEYFDIPHKVISEIPKTMLAADLYDSADYGPMLRGHKARFETWVSFLEKNGLNHIYADGEDCGAAFAAARAAAEFPPEMPTLPHQTQADRVQRAAWRAQKDKAQTRALALKAVRRIKRSVLTVVKWIRS